MSIPSRFHSRCQQCDRPIEPGEFIDRNDEGVWVHSECRDLDETVLERHRPRPICPRCWLEMPCGCEEDQ